MKKLALSVICRTGSIAAALLLLGCGAEREPIALDPLLSLPEPPSLVEESNANTPLSKDIALLVSNNTKALASWLNRENTRGAELTGILLSQQAAENAEHSYKFVTDVMLQIKKRFGRIKIVQSLDEAKAAGFGQAILVDITYRKTQESSAFGPFPTHITWSNKFFVMDVDKAAVIKVIRGDGVSDCLIPAGSGYMDAYNKCNLDSRAQSIEKLSAALDRLNIR